MGLANARMLTECLYPRNLNFPCLVGSSVSAMKRVTTWLSSIEDTCVEVPCCICASLKGTTSYSTDTVAAAAAASLSRPWQTCTLSWLRFFDHTMALHLRAGAGTRVLAEAPAWLDRRSMLDDSMVDKANVMVSRGAVPRARMTLRRQALAGHRQITQATCDRC